jgi:predicted DNA repair protein MutK
VASSLLLLLDDIASVLDDVAALTKVAAKKTAGVLGDDLALNAQQVTGVRADRELPVVWAVAKGSLVNKAILVPAALVIGTWLPWAVMPLLMAGGAFLCFEGVEKIAHKFLHRAEADDEREQLAQAVADGQADLPAIERQKIKGAIRTDFILSAEIIVITLGTVAQQTFLTQLTVLTGIALVMTAGVYGLVAGIVKIDDAALYLSQRASAAAQATGRVLLRLAPWLMKSLSVIGTLAMFLVGGGIIAHGIPPLGHAISDWTEPLGAVIGTLVSMLGSMGIGLVVGAAVLMVVLGVKRVRGVA